VILEYNDLVARADLSSSIEAAFGYNGMGLLVVKGVPNFVQYRNQLLTLAPQFASQSDSVKDKVVHKESNYSFGWSHGKEILRPGQFDTYKGSYYNNPQHDHPFSDPVMIKQFPENCHPNIWPDKDFPQLAPAFKQLGQLMVDVGLLVAEQCDKYVQQRLPAAKPNLLHEIIKESLVCKARLLYYLPINDDSTPRTRDSWCGWHNDHSSLTGLCPAMYMKLDETNSGKVQEYDIPLPDPSAGLYARTRDGKEVQVKIPRDCIAFQIGECSQVQTGGVLRATPHAVQAIAHPASVNVGRGTFAVFMQPNIDVLLEVPAGIKVEDVQVGQYKAGMTFADFAKATIDNYYSE